MAGGASRVRLATRIVAFCCAGIWLAVIALVGAEAPGPRPAAAAGQNAAAVVVDDGSGPRSFCVLFSGESISGLEALQATNLGVTKRAFGAKGAAICGIGGTGCGDGTDCLTCKAPNYWGYSRAAAGAGGFTYSMAGAGTTTVTNGAVEGWLWGQGGSPAFRSFAEICGDIGGGGGAGGGGGGTPPPGGTPGAGGSGSTGNPAGSGGGGAAGSGPGGPGSGQGSGTGGGSGSASGAGAPVTSIDPVTGEVVTVIPAGDPAASTDPAATPTLTGTGTVVDADTAAAALAATDGDEASGGSAGEGGGWVGWVVFGVIVAAIATAGVVLRLRRGPA